MTSRSLPIPENGVLILVSGGIDSAVMAAALHARGLVACALHASLGNPIDACQLHRVTLLCKRLGLTLDHVALSYSPCVIPASDYGSASGFLGLQSLLGLAAALAWSRSIRRIALGLTRDDLEGAPATEWITAWQTQASVAVRGEYRFSVELPLSHMYKREVVALGHAFDLPLQEITWSCSRSGDSHCGDCPGCRSRESAFGIPSSPVAPPLDLHFQPTRN